MRSVSWLPLCLLSLHHSHFLSPLPSPLLSLTPLSSSPLPTLLLPTSHSHPLPSLLHTLLIPPSPPPNSSLLFSTLFSPFSLTHFPEEKYGCEVCIIPVDFSEGHELYPRIAEQLQDLDIGVLGEVPSAISTIFFSKQLSARSTLHNYYLFQ